MLSYIWLKLLFTASKRVDNRLSEPIGKAVNLDHVDDALFCFLSLLPFQVYLSRLGVSTLAS